MGSSANDIQVGGEHYKSEYQHWDWCINIRLGYLESAATKYVTRWRGKNGIVDVEKAIHYLIKAKEAFLQGRLKNWSMFGDKAYIETAQRETRRWLESNGISGVEADFMWEVAIWRDDADLSVAIGKARQVLHMAQEAAGQGTGAAGRAGGRVGQGAASSASSEPSDGSSLGMEHPFGYDGEG